MYIHVDDQSSLDRERLTGLGAIVIPLAESYRTRWGSYALVRATLKLLACATREKYDRYVLISGGDLPLHCKSVLKERLAAREIVMSCWHELSASKISASRQLRNDVFKRHYLDFSLLNPRTDPFGHWWLDKCWRQVVKGMNTLVAGIPIPARLETHGTYYRGPQFWALSHDVVQFLFGEIGRNPEKYHQRFRLMYAPDEVIFQTLLMHSSYREQIKWVQRKNDTCHGIQFINYHRSGAYLCRDDIPELSASSALFARKVDPKKNPDVISHFFDKIDSSGLPKV